MSVQTFEYTAASGKRFRAITLRALLEAAGLKADGARPIYGARETPYQGVPIVLLESLSSSNETEQTVGEDAVLALLGRVLRGRMAPVDAARAIAAVAPRKRGRPRKTG